MAIVAPAPEAVASPPMPWPEDLAEAQSHLGVYGYSALDSERWQVAPSVETGVPPQLELRVTGHKEVEGHTYYKVECSLTLRGPRKLDWQVFRRLLRLRGELHDSVKSELGTSYTQHFEGKPFAARGGMRGTTAVLDVWCQALAACINAGGAPPRVVALALRFLEVPEPRAATACPDQAVGQLSPTSATRSQAWNGVSTEGNAQETGNSDEPVRGEREPEDASAAREATAQATQEEVRTIEQEAEQAAAKEKHEEEERNQREAEETARREAEEKATREAGEIARREAEEKAKREAEERARQAAEESDRREEEERSRIEEEQAQLEAEARRKEEEEKAAEMAKREQEARAQREAEEAARREAEDKTRREEERILREQEEARLEAERKKKENEEKAPQEAEENAKKEAQAKRMKQEAEERQRQDQEEKEQRAMKEAERTGADEAIEVDASDVESTEEGDHGA